MIGSAVRPDPAAAEQGVRKQETFLHTKCVNPEKLFADKKQPARSCGFLAQKESSLQTAVSRSREEHSHRSL